MTEEIHDTVSGVEALTELLRQLKASEVAGEGQGRVCQGGAGDDEGDQGLDEPHGAPRSVRAKTTRGGRDESAESSPRAVTVPGEPRTSTCLGRVSGGFAEKRNYTLGASVHASGPRASYPRPQGRAAGANTGAGDRALLSPGSAATPARDSSPRGPRGRLRTASAVRCVRRARKGRDGQCPCLVLLEEICCFVLEEELTIIDQNA